MKYRKPLTFTTTLRNPNRIVQFASVLSNFENDKLNHDTICKIEAEFIGYDIYEPTKSTLGTYVSSYRDYIASDKSKSASTKVRNIFNKYHEWKINGAKHKPFSLDKIEYLLKNTRTKHDHHEQGYIYGWESRFCTQVTFLNELGFVYAKKNEKLKISPNCKLLISNFINGHAKRNISSKNDDLEHSAFLTAFSKYQTNNPWRQNTIKMNFMSFFLRTMLYLRGQKQEATVNKSELTFFATWPNNNFKKLGNFLIKFRNRYNFNASPNIVYKYAMNLLDPNSKKTFSKASIKYITKNRNQSKSRQLLNEIPDDIFRKLRYTRILSVDPTGNYLKLNTSKADKKKIKYIIQNFHDIKNSSPIIKSKKRYFKYMGKLNNHLLFTDKYSSKELKAIDRAKLCVLKKESINFSWNFIEQQMKISCTHNKLTKNNLLKDMNVSTRMEFLSAIAIQKSIGNVAKVNPHYKTNELGVPTHTAPGKSNGSSGADISVSQKNIRLLLEVTTTLSESIQRNEEVPSIETHLYEEIHNNKSNNYNNTFSIFLAYKIRPATYRLIRAFRLEDSKKNIINYNNMKCFQINGYFQFYAWCVNNFIKLSKGAKSLRDYMHDDSEILK